MVNAVDMVWKHAADQGSALAVTSDDVSWTYEELRRRIASWAVRLREADVAHGDRVLLVAPTSAEYVAVYHGILAVGAVAVTVNSTLGFTSFAPAMNACIRRFTSGMGKPPTMPIRLLLVMPPASMPVR